MAPGKAILCVVSVYIVGVMLPPANGKKAPLFQAKSSNVLPDEYLVVINNPSSFERSCGSLVKAMAGRLSVQREYKIGNWNAVLVHADAHALDAIREDPNVAFVETNHIIDVHSGLVSEGKPKNEKDQQQGYFPKKHDQPLSDNEVVGKANDVLNHDRKQYIIHVKKREANLVQLRQNLQSEFPGTLVINREFHINNWQALVVEMDSETAEQVKKDPLVTFVEEDQNVKMSATISEFTDLDLTTHSTFSGVDCYQQDTGYVLWGLSRISSRDLPSYPTAVYKYSDSHNGQGIDIYVMDSGVYLQHEEFEGRAVWGMTTSSLQNEGDLDLDGHGTHVASTAAGKTYGVAKKAKVVAVKVLNGQGKGTIAGIVEGIEWTVSKAQSEKKVGRSVVNLSLGVVGYSITLEGVVQGAADVGLPFVLAAGNDAKDACDFTPGRHSAGLTVAASSIDDSLAYYSNYGPCTDVVAPGSDILGASNTDQEGSTIMSGTSMATPHVSGTIASYLSSLDAANNPSPAEIRQFIIDSSSNGHVHLQNISRQSTPNRMLYKSCDAASPAPTDEPQNGLCYHQDSMRRLWGLTRISSRSASVDYTSGQYHYGETDDGTEVDVYVMDTGVYLGHHDFQGRASWGMTATGIAAEGNGDLNGHGTHVASIVAGKEYGVAKSANIISVKVLDANGEGGVVGVIEGLEWISNEADRRKNATEAPKGSIINLSLGIGDYVYALEVAVQELVDAGVTVIVAAGNDGTEACFTTPARMSSVITVGATDRLDGLAYFSNRGSCVDILAPGDGITAASRTGSSSSSMLSGTSQAAPHVAGVAARYLSSLQGRAPTPEEVKAAILGRSTHSVIQLADSMSSTPNYLVYASCEDNLLATPTQDSMATMATGSHTGCLVFVILQHIHFIWQRYL